MLKLLTFIGLGILILIALGIFAILAYSVTIFILMAYKEVQKIARNK